MNKKVFLGGTCNDSTWRDELIPMLNIDYFNPVVDDWTEECYLEELTQRKACDYCLYVITPDMTGVYSIAEVVDDSNKRPNKTIFCVLNSIDKPFTEGQMRSLDRVGKMVEGNGGKYFTGLEEVANYLNEQYTELDVLFRNSRGEKRKIATVLTIKEAYSEIEKFCNDRNFKCHYMRSWTEEDETVVDVGSHTEAFYIVKGKVVSSQHKQQQSETKKMYKITIGSGIEHVVGHCTKEETIYEIIKSDIGYITNVNNLRLRRDGNYITAAYIDDEDKYHQIQYFIREEELLD